AHRRELLAEYRLDPLRVVTIPNAVDLDRFSPASGPSMLRSELKLGPHVPVIGILGRFTEQKGHRYLFEALPSLIADFPDLQCLIVGDGPERPDLEQRARRLGVADHTWFLGVRRDIRNVLAGLNVLVVPSISEGMPYVVLEGMAMAKPIVATAVNGIPELLEDHVTGRLVPPRTVGALAGAIRDLLRDADVSEVYGRAARSAVEKRHSLDQWIATIERLYEDVLPRGGETA